MSLLDALLTEGWRDPRDNYIALRADGQKGSGTVDDPYHGSVVENPAIPAALSLATGTNPREIIVTTASARGFIEGDIVHPSDARNCDTVLIEDNVFALERPAPIHFNLSGRVSCVNNRTPQGTLLKANDTSTGEAPYDPAAQVVESYFPGAEDALALAMM